MGRNPKDEPAVFRYTVRFNEEKHNRFLSMFKKSGVSARSVFIKEHFFGQPFKMLVVDSTFVEYYTKLSDFHAQQSHRNELQPSSEVIEWGQKKILGGIFHRIFHDVLW